MEALGYKHKRHHVELPVAVIATGMHRLVCITKPARITKPRRETHITV
ncbi:hypothetical protein FOC34_21410 [Burkholderia multivorans]|nr:hypothetical protein [Burkholderia multivorans]QGR87738.1 hypothetical protein FOC34_21410 [Burkholderia multivorans]